MLIYTITNQIASTQLRKWLIDELGVDPKKNLNNQLTFKVANHQSDYIGEALDEEDLEYTTEQEDSTQNQVVQIS